MKNLLDINHCAILALGLGASVWATSAISGTSEAQLNKCAIIAESTKRLACFDAVAPAPAVFSKKSQGKWKIASETNPLDDTKTVIAQLNANNSVEGWPRKRVVPIFAVRCLSGKLDAFFVTGMAADVETSDLGYYTLKLRLDRDPAFEIKATEATSNDALFFVNPASVLSKLQGKSSMLVQFVPLNSPSVQTTFTLEGLPKAVKAVKEACPSELADWATD